MQTPLLSVSGLYRDFGDVTAVDGFDVDLAAGECVALIGHNGSGKSTVLRVAAGRLEPTSGTVTVAGVDIHSRRRGPVMFAMWLATGPILAELALALPAEMIRGAAGARGAAAALLVTLVAAVAFLRRRREPV